ncbi:restriction endonuclease [Helicobacter didelphidarum]|uniref:Restriction endonuclease n=2 Tax=Helicobacter didelphidarum TaxID=2040648 RepID=A0A3D8IAE0_9HELI|nr:DNA adenine methylase [Helicobacter didelphidarum]RDU62068.1 restriction endonuclease [Helicobacter didelphidarum]
MKSVDSHKISQIIESAHNLKDNANKSRKQAFLTTLKSKSSGNYKRYTKSPLRYGGGKSLAVGLIIENLPCDTKRVISPFIGGGSVEVACALELGLEVKAFDIFDILVNFWQVLLRDSKALYEELAKLEPDKKTYEAIKDELKAYWNERHKNRESRTHKPQIKLDSLTLARDYYFNFNLSYGPGFLGWMSKIYEDKTRYLSALQKLRDFSVPNLSVECASFESVFELYPRDFFYLDPPYFLEGDSKMFRGIYPMRNFPIHHNGFNHELLRECLKNHKGKFILSYNDCAFVREAYRGFRILEPKWQYTMGQGETRVGKNRIERGDKDNIKQSHELLIMNF